MTASMEGRFRIRGKNMAISGFHSETPVGEKRQDRTIDLRRSELRVRCLAFAFEKTRGNFPARRNFNGNPREAERSPSSSDVWRAQASQQYGYRRIG